MKTIPYALLPFERNKCGKVFMMVVIEPGVSLPQSFTVEVELKVKRRKTVLNGVEGCKKPYYNFKFDKEILSSN